ncbi:MAG: class I SAM-dependent methyltransferase, partial [Methanoregula sp.]|nr:class I SAM-dependent methyltransferase [Methanoregula sp.]
MIWSFYQEVSTILIQEQEYDTLKKSYTGPWEEDYTRRGMLWSGAIHNLPELPSSSCVLELGCGNGKTAIPMIQQGWDVISLDFSSKAVALCKKAIPDLLHGQVMIADARWPPFRDSTFDAVFAIHVIAHMYATDRKCVASEIIRLLRPGGMLFFCEFSTDDFRFGKGHETEEATFRRGTGIITHYFSEDEVSGLFSGLTAVSITQHTWLIRVRGCSLMRSEVYGIF